jgi:DNA-binding MarR family transcriptional regulator
MPLATASESKPLKAVVSGVKQPNLKQLLLSRSDWFAEEIMKDIRKSDFAHISAAQSRLLAHMGGKPCSMAELGRRLAISRQAVHKTVAELVRQGVLQVLDDPARGNSKLVTYTELGKQVNRAGAQIIERIEQRLRQQIGQDNVEQLKSLLGTEWR